MNADRTSEKKQVRVTIFNQAYTIVTAGDPAETEELARRVDELMYSIAKRSGNVDSARAAVLACLHLADQLRTLERELAGLRERVDSKTREFSVLLDQVVGE